MTDYTAIYEAGESIVNLLRHEMSPEPIAKPEYIGLCEPQSPEDFRLTAWIYAFDEQKDNGTRTGFMPDPTNPQIERYAPLQLKLHLLISAHSKAPAITKNADEYRIIGRAMQALVDHPSIPEEYLVGTLSEQPQPVLITLAKLNSEELVRIWNNTSKTVRPSFGIEISQVYIKSGRTRAAAPRVASADFDTRFRKNGVKGS